MASSGLPAVLGTVTLANDQSAGSRHRQEIALGQLSHANDTGESPLDDDRVDAMSTFLEDALVKVLCEQDAANLTRPQLALLEKARGRPPQTTRSTGSSPKRKITNETKPRPPRPSTPPPAHVAEHASLVEQDVHDWLNGDRATTPTLRPHPPLQTEADATDKRAIQGGMSSTAPRQGRKSPRKAIIKQSQNTIDTKIVEPGVRSTAVAATATIHRALDADDSDGSRGDPPMTQLEETLESLKFARPRKSVFLEILQSPRRLDDLSERANEHVVSQIEIIKSVQQAGMYPEPVAVFKEDTDRDESNLDLSHRGLGDDKLVAATKVAVRGRNLAMLDLSENRLSDNGGASIFGSIGSETDPEAVKIAKPLTLVLARNALGARSCDALTSLLRSSSHRICELNLSRNKLDSRCMAALSVALAEDSTLKRLDVSYNPLGPAGVSQLANALVRNETLRVLSVAWTQAGAIGALAILRAIHRNDKADLESLDLSRNAIGRALSSNLVNLPAATPGDVVGTLCKLLEAVSQGNGAHSSTATLKSSSSNAMLRRKRSEVSLGSNRGTTRHQTSVRKRGLIHLNLGHNLIPAAACQRIAESLAVNRTLVGIHLDGNAGFVDAMGKLHFASKRKQEKEDPIANSPGPTHSMLRESDASEEMCATIHQTDGLSVRTRFEMIAAAWTPHATCWVCAGFLPKRFAICAKKSARVLLHTHFDYPPWAGCPMTEFKIADSCKPTDSSDDNLLDPMLTNKVDHIAAAAMRLGENLFDMAEFVVNRVCPPGEVAFFFTVDGVPTVSDLEQQTSWALVSARDRVNPPRQSDEKDFILNVATIEARQTLARIDLGNRRDPLDVDASFRVAHSPSTWALEAEIQSKSSCRDMVGLENNNNNNNHQSNSGSDQYDPFKILLPGSRREFWARSPPRNLELVSPPLEEQLKTRPDDIGFRAGPSWIGTRLDAHFRAQFSADSRAVLFQGDWIASEIDALISSRVEQERTRALLEESYEHLCNVFAVYSTLDCASSLPRSACLLSVDGAMTMYEHVTRGGCVEKYQLCSWTQAEQTYEIVLKEQLQRYQNQQRKLKITLARQSTAGTLVEGSAGKHEPPQVWGLTRAKFLTFLLKLALVSFGEKAVHESIALSILLDRFVFPRAQRFDREGYLRARLQDKPVHEVFGRNIPTLLRLYASNAGTHQTGFEMAWMSIGEWLRNLNLAGLLTARAAAKTFEAQNSKNVSTQPAATFSKPSMYPDETGTRSAESSPPTHNIVEGNVSVDRAIAVLFFSACIPWSSQDEPSHSRYFKMDFPSYLLAMSCVVALAVDRSSLDDFFITGATCKVAQARRASLLKHRTSTPAHGSARRISTQLILRRISKAA